MANQNKQYGMSRASNSAQPPCLSKREINGAEKSELHKKKSSTN